MAFTSQLYPRESIIDDSNFHSLVGVDPIIGGERKTRGRIPRDYAKHPFGSVCQPFSGDLIPRDEWDSRIEEMERTKTRVSDICDQAGLICKDQNGTNYCWINAPTHCYEIARVIQNQPLIYFSPASVGGPIKGYSNSGGWGTEGVEYIADHGIVPVEFWPANAISRKYYDDTLAIRAKYKIPEWDDMPARNFDAMMTKLLNRNPVAVGYNWWSHEVSAIDPVILDSAYLNALDRQIREMSPLQLRAAAEPHWLGHPDDLIREWLRQQASSKYGVRFRNSWGMSYGDRGYNVLNESKGTPSDAVASRAVTPS